MWSNSISTECLQLALLLIFFSYEITSWHSVVEIRKDRFSVHVKKITEKNTEVTSTSGLWSCLYYGCGIQVALPNLLVRIVSTFIMRGICLSPELCVQTLFSVWEHRRRMVLSRKEEEKSLANTNNSNSNCKG